MNKLCVLFFIFVSSKFGSSQVSYTRPDRGSPESSESSGSVDNAPQRYSYQGSQGNTYQGSQQNYYPGTQSNFYQGGPQNSFPPGDPYNFPPVGYPGGGGLGPYGPYRSPGDLESFFGRIFRAKLFALGNLAPRYPLPFPPPIGGFPGGGFGFPPGGFPGFPPYPVGGYTPYFNNGGNFNQGSFGPPGEYSNAYPNNGGSSGSSGGSGIA